MQSQFRRATAAVIRITLATAQVMTAITATGLLRSPNLAIARSPDLVRVTAPDAGNVTGTVFNDLNGNGARDAGDTGYEGVTVTAYGSGAPVSTVTNASGAYTLTVTSNDVRIEFTNYTGMQSSPVGTNSNTSVRFVISPATNVDFGIFNPTGFCQNNPNLILSCFVFGDNVNGAGKDDRTVVSYPYNATGTNTALQVPEALARQVGSVYGMGYQRTSKYVFASSYTKRLTGYGPGTGAATSDGTGTIYMFKAGAPADAVPFVDLDDLFGATTTGNNPHTGFTLQPNNFDNGAYAFVGKMGLGDLDIGEDDKTVWVVNLANQKLYGLPIGLTPALVPTAPTAAQVVSTNVPNPGCVNGIGRPFGIKPHKGLIYVGGVCTGENLAPTAGVTNDLQAYVYAYNPTNNTWSANPVLQFPLNYVRHCIDIFPSYPTICKPGSNGSIALWRPWRDTLDTTFPAGFSDGFTANPEPMLTDIEFVPSASGVNSDMVVAFRDRFPDQVGFNDPGPQNNSPRGFLLNALPGGDILRAGLNASGLWTIESNSQSVPPGRFGPTAGAGSGEGPGGGEFYYGEELTGVHDETILGSLAFAPNFTTVVATAVDPIRAVTAGTIKLNNTDGSQTNAYELYAPPPAPASANNFRKANGLGDLELLCDAAPIEIGNRVWLDANSNGIQDPGEAVLANIQVRLTDSLGNSTTATTNSNGNYTFSSAAGANTASAIYNLNTSAPGSVTLTPFGAYTLTIDLTQPNLAAYVPTTPNADASANGTARDSNGVQNGTLVNAGVVLAGPGYNNHTYDFGFANRAVALAALGNYVWEDNNGDGIQNEPAINGRNGITVTLFNAANPGTPISTTLTAADPFGNPGYYTFTNLSPGDYIVCFTRPVGFDFTLQGQGGNGALDSDANINTGCTVSIPLASGEVNPNIDAGIVRPASLGNYVWMDDSRDGTQNEPALRGQNGITVTLRRTSDNQVIGTKLTAADALGNPGYYTFTNLAPGNYYVCFTLPLGVVFTGQDLGGNDALDSDANASTGCTVNVPLASGEVNPTVDAGLFQAIPAIVLKKYTNGFDADTVTGPQLLVGSTVTWTYNVTNTGNVNLFAVALVDNIEGAVTCPKNNLAVGETMTCIKTGIAKVGQYANTGVVTGTSSFDESTKVTSADPSHYFGVALASLGNYVWEDTNYDGVQNEPTANGRNGVLVTLRNAADNSVVGTQTTINDPFGNPGYYTFTNLLPGNYIVCFTAPAGYIITKQGQGGNGTTDSDASANDGCTASITLASGEVNPNVDAGLFQANPQIKLTKYTNGEDADTPPGPLVIVGDTITWTYVFTNIGNITLTNVAVSDDKIGAVCAGFTLAPGQSQTCTKNGIAAEGQYANLGTVIGTNQLNPAQQVSSTNPSHYFAMNPKIVLKKYTNGFDADVPPGPGLPLGSAVTWTYVVTNTGNVVLTNVMLTDDKIGPITCPKTTLAVNETMTCTANGVAAAGQYANTGVITGTNQLNPAQKVTSTDPSHYFGTNQPLASLGNFVWVDGNRDGQQGAGEPGIPGITVTLRNITGTVIATAQTGAGGFYSFTNLLPGSYSVCFVLPPGYVLTGQGGDPNSDTDSNANPATGCTAAVTLAPGDNNPTIDTGVVVSAPSIKLTKYTNGFDADLPPGPQLNVGSVVTWTYLITNTGDVTLTTVTLTDDKLGAVTCPKTVLAPAESMICTRTGIAVAGQYTNTAVVTGTNQLAPAQQVTSTNPSHYFGVAPLLVIAKTSDPPNGTSVISRTLITYSLHVTNTGDFTATNVIVDDPIPANTTYVTGSAVPTVQSGPTPLVWNLGTLAPKQSAVVKFTVKVIDRVATAIQNQGGVRADGIPRIPSNVIVHPILPTAVQLTRFDVKPEGDALRISWATGSEVDTFGFAIYRSEDASGAGKVLVTNELLSAKGSGSNYSVLDTSANKTNRYFYWLQETEKTGSVIEYTPVQWQPATAQAVSVNTSGVVVAGGVPGAVQVVQPAANNAGGATNELRAQANAQSAVAVAAQPVAAALANSASAPSAASVASQPQASVPEANALVQPAVAKHEVAVAAQQQAAAAQQTVAKPQQPAQNAEKAASQVVQARLPSNQTQTQKVAVKVIASSTQSSTSTGLVLVALMALAGLLVGATMVVAYYMARRRKF